MNRKLWAAQPSDIQKLHTLGLPLPPWDAIDVPRQISVAEKIAEITLNKPFGQRELYFYQEVIGNLVLLVWLRDSASSCSVPHDLRHQSRAGGLHGLKVSCQNR
ncbi:hypothetical protein [Comamonas thiooxydans]|uniref:hypothetical protein n=1 Tax=Comamonas thiooxydans TaxID=363952 RepID=UPI0005A0A781|nr:hypothetical protein [Comamonas thiooxydans]MDO1476863.1 hypothetical protein [Comamonas thiooxydans]